MKPEYLVSDIEYTMHLRTLKKNHSKNGKRLNLKLTTMKNASRRFLQLEIKLETRKRGVLADFL